LPCTAESKRQTAGRGRAAVAPLRRELIAGRAPRFDVEAVQETGSTNLDLLQRARVLQPARPLLRAALRQTAGRGRHGRRWFARAGDALLFSLAVPMRSGSDRIAAATLACGVGVAEWLRAAGAPVTLKWPNDLMFDGCKLGGVLCELALDEQGRRTLVVGIGINLRLDDATRDSIGQPATALDALEPALAAPESLIGGIAEGVLDALLLFDAQGFVPLQPRFMALFAQRDALVELLELGARVASGRALGVDGDGRLLLDTAQGLRVCGSGELSLRVSR
jgi:BirA family biotin operon repressor/biotin-[acetyl-CoA-carboxylase] ligase